MPTYRFVGDTPKSIPSISVEVAPGDVFESPVPLEGTEFDLVEQPKSSSTKAEAEPAADSSPIQED